ncbi:MAG: hydrogenase maturation protease [Rhodococcus sp. (in: high G+C Gram-positive bacteria)]|uniref:hydrogenase maturation protease n=1 Tax=Rhodococcus sp. TaxID=1831 RepID=UPI003BAE8A07
MTIVLIGLGNEYRRDDGIGPAVAREVAYRLGPAVSVSVSDGDPTLLLEAWAAADLAVLVDAVMCDPSRPGTVHRLPLDAAAEMPTASTSTHGIGLGDAFRLGSALNRLPRSAVLYVVEVADVGPGRGFSPPVRHAVAPTVTAVLRELAPLHQPSPATYPSRRSRLSGRSVVDS